MKEDLNNKIFFGKYKTEKILGKGSFGYVFKGKNIINNELVAIKTEDYKIKGDVLESEAYFLVYLKNFGIPEVKSFGVYKKYKILVQTLLDKDLETLFSKYSHINAKDICMIFIQLLDRLEFVHSKYVIHRDLKPENIMFDLETKKIIYLIDFGMAKKYRSGKTKKHIKFSIPSRLTGTARYCSINALRGTEQSRRDDLESLGYVMIYLARKRFLPWMGLTAKNKLERYRQIYKMKKEISENKLCQGLPKEFIDYMKYTKKLKFEEDPNYNYLRGLFINLLNFYQFKNDLNFSWIQKNQRNKNIIKQRNIFYKKKEGPQQRILRKIQTSQEKENNMENIKKEKIGEILEQKQEKRDNDALKINIKNEIKETHNKINNITVIKNNENLLKSPSFYINNKENKEKNNDESFKENKTININETEIVELNLPIIVDDSDSTNKNKQNENNNNNINNNNKNLNNNINKDTNNNSINNININNEKENNIFSFNDSIQKINDILNNKSINFSKEKNIKISNSGKNLFSPAKYLNLISDKSPINFQNEKNNLINKTSANINMNSGKVINIIYNNNEQIRYKNNSPNEIENSRKIRPYQIQNKNNHIHNINIKNMIVGRKQLKKIFLNKIKKEDNSINDINSTNLINSNSNDNIRKNYHYSINEKNNENNKTLNSYLSYNSANLKKGTNTKRNTINFNKASIKRASSQGDKISKIFNNNWLNYDNNPSLIINNSSKKIHRLPRQYEQRIYKNLSLLRKNASRQILNNKNMSRNYNNNYNKNINNINNKIYKSTKNNNKTLPKINYIPVNLVNLHNNLNNTYNISYAIKKRNNPPFKNNNNNNQNNKNYQINTLNNKVTEYKGLKRIKISKKKLKNIIPINDNINLNNIGKNILSKDYLKYKMDNINYNNNVINDI